MERENRLQASHPFAKLDCVINVTEANVNMQLYCPLLLATMTAK
jgi:hypothetical protein